MTLLRSFCVVILLLTACAMPTPNDSHSPAIRGYITSRSSNAILVEEDPKQSAGSAKASAQLTPQTKIVTADGQEGGAGDLKVGQFVAVWFVGPVAESYPVRGTAAHVSIERQAPAQRQTPAERQVSNAGGVELSAERRGASKVMLALRNGSASPIGYNLCSSPLQRRTSGGWQNVPTDEMCTMEIRELRPGGVATFEKTLPANASGGDYRYVTTIDRPEGRLEVASNTFDLP